MSHKPIETTVEFLASQHDSLPSASEETAAKPVEGTEIVELTGTVQSEVAVFGKTDHGKNGSGIVGTDRNRT